MVYRDRGGFHDRDRDAEPPPAATRNGLLPYVAFFLVVAVLAGAAGYALNRMVGPAHRARTATTANPPGASPSAAVSSGFPTAPTAAPDTVGPAPGGPGGGLTNLTAEQVAIRLAEAGLPLHTTVVYTAATDPDRLLGTAGGYSSRIAFSDPRVGSNEVAGAPAGAIERGGAIEAFRDAAAAQRRATRLLTVTENNPLITEYVYVRGGVVVRVSLVLTEQQAKGYEAALQRLGS
ncbi:hypothetical protein [Frankia sp. QA3]|uniref:hypothetical protein n=1 Tax=Frankia sp. QA3 TaxID=710111 RepID=UPI000269CDC4|nr:hypothetical protein [Frankia sp. QA3]EIV95685.1 hypothetical protein FraQA3DRAFT_5528 [Frankia sp. QA3]